MSGKSTKTAAQRFATKYAVSEHGCWLWTACLAKNGYAKFGVGGKHGGVDYGHRVSWRLRHGEVPAGLFVCHKCDHFYAAGDFTYRRCVNPEHLFVGTQVDNMQDMLAKGRGFKAGDPRLARGDKNGARLHPERLARGEKHSNCKLTDAELARMQLMLANNADRAVVAVEFKVSASLVEKVDRGVYRTPPSRAKAAP